MRLDKALVRSEWGSAIICWLIQLYLRLVFATGNWQVIGTEIAAKLCDEKRPFVAGFWHGRLLMLPFAWRRMAPLHMLISSHADGRLIAGAVRYFGIEWIHQMRDVVAALCLGSVVAEGINGGKVHPGTIK